MFVEIASRSEPHRVLAADRFLRISQGGRPLVFGGGRECRILFLQLGRSERVGRFESGVLLQSEPGSACTDESRRGYDSRER